jgi:hypothetical protein
MRGEARLCALRASVPPLPGRSLDAGDDIESSPKHASAHPALLACAGLSDATSVSRRKGFAAYSSSAAMLGALKWSSIKSEKQSASALTSSFC